jgi:hypothetical protein
MKNFLIIAHNYENFEGSNITEAFFQDNFLSSFTLKQKTTIKDLNPKLSYV